MSLQCFDNVLEMIGNTPLMAVRHLDTGPCELFVKLENQNPGGSIKDRIGLSMIEAAERDGHIKPGGTLIEATAGNTGLGLALVAAQKGYRLLLVIPDKMSQEKIFHLRALGAEVRMTRSDVQQGPSGVLPGPGRAPGARDARRLLRQPVRQSRPTRRRTRRPPRPEIWEQMGHAARCGGVRRRHRRHAHRAVAFLRARRAARGDGAGRSGRLGAGATTRRPASCPRR